MGSRLQNGDQDGRSFRKGKSHAKIAGTGTRAKRASFSVTTCSCLGGTNFRAAGPGSILKSSESALIGSSDGRRRLKRRATKAKGELIMASAAKRGDDHGRKGEKNAYNEVNWLDVNNCEGGRLDASYKR